MSESVTHPVGSSVPSCQGAGVPIDIDRGGGLDRESGPGDLLDPVPPGAGVLLEALRPGP